MEKRLYLLLILLFLIGCNGNFTKQAKAFRNATIEFPSEGMIAYTAGERTFRSEVDIAPLLMVVYYDSTLCNACEVSHIGTLRPLFEHTDSLGYQVITIFSPAREKRLETKTSLELSSFEYPVYYDENGLFAKANQNIPQDERLHSFLLGKDRKPIFIGNPVKNEKLWNLFKKVISENQ